MSSNGEETLEPKEKDTSSEFEHAATFGFLDGGRSRGRRAHLE
jgi:hypothetical protein